LYSLSNNGAMMYWAVSALSANGARDSRIEDETSEVFEHEN